MTLLRRASRLDALQASVCQSQVVTPTPADGHLWYLFTEVCAVLRKSGFKVFLHPHKLAVVICVKTLCHTVEIVKYLIFYTKRN